MTTARELITASLKDAGVVGVGQTASSEDANDSLIRLNAMMAQWSRRRWLVYHLIDQVFPATGALSYSIGNGGDISTTRPDQIEAAFFRQTAGAPGNQVDYQLHILHSREDYNRIALKAMNSFPQCLFYDSGFPLGNVFIWPVPSNLYEIHLSLKSSLQSFPTLDTAILLPPEYEEALRLNLTIRIRIAYQLPPDQQLIALAKVALNTIKNSNAQIPNLRMPSDLTAGSAGSRYNIFSDQGG